MVFPDPRFSTEARGSGPPVGLYDHARQHEGESIAILGYRESETGMGNSPASRLRIPTGTRPYINRNHILPPSLEPATMTPTFTTSDDALYQFTQGYPDSPIIPIVVPQLSLFNDGTINPTLLTSRNHELPPQYDLSSISMCTSGDGHDHHSSPAPSGSPDVWMGHPGDQPWTSAPSPISPMVDNTVSPLEV